MRYFNLLPNGVENEVVSEALQAIGPLLENAGAKRAFLLVEDAAGVTIAHAALGAADDTPKEAADLLLRVALDAKSLAGGDGRR